ncbi:MAG: hypothetical protein IJ728_10740 [Selenomonadaceae bacterium]|nr:hypothetical protein [Selenomonadaceae bacterium]
MTSLEYTLECNAGKKTITINNVRSDIDSQVAKVNAFADELTAYLDGDYSPTAATKITTEETPINLGLGS